MFVRVRTMQRAVEAERLYWQTLVEKLMNRIQDPVSEVARSQIDHDEMRAPTYGDPEDEARRLSVEGVRLELERRGLDPSLLDE